jgi:4-cresol dehydrogenase (hydroxylating) flavoprotein subunit
MTKGRSGTGVGSGSPPTKAGVDQAIDRFRTIVGDDHVLSTPDDLHAHARDTSLWHRVGSAVVYPATAEEVAAIVRVAAELELAVWPFSKGKNWGYGATMALLDGAVILLLDRMNRILEVNEELAYAVIEPGVTQGQLNAYLKQNGVKLWVDSTDSTPQGSIIGNALERGVGYTPYWDHFAHLCGMEVVLPTGDIVQTGGGPPNSLTWNTYKWGTGPYLEGLFSQSNLGIVTRAGVWLMPEPEAFSCFICEVGDDSLQPPAVDAIRRLALAGVVQANVHMVNDVMFFAQVMQYPYGLLNGSSALSDDLRAQLRKRHCIAPWTITGGLYGTSAQVRVAKAATRRALSPIGDVTFIGDRKAALIAGLVKVWKALGFVPGVGALLTRLTGSSREKLEVIPHVYPILRGEPGEYIVGFAYFKSRGPRPRVNVDPARDEAGLTWMAVVTPLTGRHTRELIELCKSAFHEHGLDFSITFIMVNPRSALGLIEIFYDRQNLDECARMQALYEDLGEATSRAGFQQYRTSVAYSERIFESAQPFQRMVDALKRAVDPSGVLAPGRYGIGLRRP